MLLVPRLQTLMVGADGDGMEGYVPSPFPESHDDGIRLLFSGLPRPSLAFRQDSAREGHGHMPPIVKHLLQYSANGVVGSVGAQGFGVWGLILRVLDAFRPRGATWSGQVISSPPGPSGGPSRRTSCLVAESPGFTELGAPSFPGVPVSPLLGQCINSQPWLRALTHCVAPLMRGRPGRRRRRARATGLSPVGLPWAGAEAA